MRRRLLNRNSGTPFIEGLPAFIYTTSNDSAYYLRRLAWLDDDHLYRVITGGDAAANTYFFEGQEPYPGVGLSGNYIDLSTNTGVASIQINDATYLEELQLLGSNVTAVDISNCPILKRLSMYGQRIVSLDLSNNPLIVFLNIGSNPTFNTTIDLSDIPLLEYFEARNTRIPSGLDFSNTPNIEFIRMDAGLSYSGVINLTGCVNLTYLNLGRVDLSANANTFLEDCTALEEIYLLSSSNAELPSGKLDLSNNTNLEVVQFQAAKFGDAKFPSLSLLVNLKTLYAYSCDITTIDISSNTLLNNVRVQLNDFAPAVTDQVYIDLDANGVSNGTLMIRDNRTSASDTARANLITKGWLITPVAYNP